MSTNETNQESESVSTDCPGVFDGKKIGKEIRQQNRHNHRQKLWVNVYSAMTNRKGLAAPPEAYADKAVEEFNKRFSAD